MRGSHGDAQRLHTGTSSLTQCHNLNAVQVLSQTIDGFLKPWPLWVSLVTYRHDMHTITVNEAFDNKLLARQVLLHHQSRSISLLVEPGEIPLLHGPDGPYSLMKVLNRLRQHHPCASPSS